MRRLITFWLVIQLLAPSFYYLGVTAYWLGNREYIASELCVKRDEPGNCCQGKCYLNKKLKAASPNSTNSGKQIANFFKGLNWLEYVCFTENFSVKHLLPKQKVSFPAFLPLFAAGFIGCLFHPPPSAALAFLFTDTTY